MNDADNLAQQLAELQPGYLPQKIFLELARLMVLTTIEVVPVRTNSNGETEVLLVQRPRGDVWSELWHVPGTVLRSTDRMAHGHDYQEPLERILGLNGELAGVEIAGEPVEIETERRRILRGDELAVIHYVEIVGEPTVGKFFPIHNYPVNVPAPGIVPHHKDFVLRAAKYYQTHR